MTVQNKNNDDSLNAATVKKGTWYIRGGRQLTPAPFLIAGIANITPDSFSDGGAYLHTETAVDHILGMVQDGADIIDIGGESTRPGAEDIGVKKEIARVLPVLTLLQTQKYREENLILSIDTFRAATAAMALEFDQVHIINDVSGGTLDPAIVEVVATYKPGYVLGHCPLPPKTMQKSPKYTDIIEELISFFTCQMNVLVKAGLPENRIVLDPCIGFAKNLSHNLQAIQGAKRLASLGRPLYYGISRKSLFTDLGATEKSEKEALTQVLVALLATKGVAIHRVHDVPATVKTLQLVASVEN